MANQEHWNVANEREMWLKVVGHEAEDRTETILQAKKIFAGVPDGRVCLEIGCGSGRFINFAKELFRSYVGVDISASILDFALKNNEACTFFLTDGQTVPLPPEGFDFVFSFTCFQHMPTLEIVLKNIQEVYRVLRPGGLCRIQTVQGDASDLGRYDGFVFESAAHFAVEFQKVGFKIQDAHTEGEWIWVTASK